YFRHSWQKQSRKTSKMYLQVCICVCGEDVTLNCSVDSHIKPEHIERDRVEFFTAEIPKGNFSLRLKSVRTEDKGVYMCLVFSGGLSANATAELEQLGESKNIAKNKEVSILSANSQPFPFSGWEWALHSWQKQSRKTSKMYLQGSIKYLTEF
uniref:Ig-like domain-containing protein n=1 Tax=Sinocyclocheilus anshuiensis TaxID=1608454 RepID=A0A671K4W7_9TELE